MGSFKTLDAFFKPVHKPPHNDADPGPHDSEPCNVLQTSYDATRPSASRPPAAPPAPALAPLRLQPVRPPPSKALAALQNLRAGASKDDLLAVMLHGRKALPAAEDAAGPEAAAAPHKPQRLVGSGEVNPSLTSERHGDRNRDHDLDHGLSATLQRQPKRPCLEPQAPCMNTAAPSAAPPRPPPLPYERRLNVTCLLQDRSTGRLAARRELWSAASPRMLQVGNWDAGMRLRPPSVIHQDAITQIEVSSADGPAYVRLAVAQANQLVRIIPYRVLRDLAEARRAAAQEADEPSDVDSGDDEGSHVDDLMSAASRHDIGCRGASDADKAVYGTLRRTGLTSRHRGRALPLAAWDNLASSASARQPPPGRPPPPPCGGPGPLSRRGGLDTSYEAGRGGGSSSCVLTLNTRQTVSALGWDPRRPGRLAYVDRSSPSVMLLDLGSGGSQGTAFTRSHLTAAPASSTGAGGSAAARALTYMRYGSTAAPYTLAAAGRASGEGAVIHLWDERRGSAPVSRLACPGGAPLVAAVEPSPDGTALVGVVHPGMLVIWDVRRASNTAAGGALMSLGASAPSPSAVVGGWDLLGPLAAAGCRRPLLSSVSLDPRDAGSLALLTQDGSSALWSLRSSALTHTCLAPPPAAAVAATGVAAVGARAAATRTTATTATTTATLMALVGPGPVPVHVIRPQSSTATGVCALVGALYGSWDADACGFWHPVAMARGTQAGAGGDAAAGTRPGLALANFRAGAGLITTASMPRAVATATVTAVAEGATAAAAQGQSPRVTSASFDEWPVCVACMPCTGEVVVGTLGGQLSYWWKAWGR